MENKEKVGEIEEAKKRSPLKYMRQVTKKMSLIKEVSEYSDKLGPGRQNTIANQYNQLEQYVNESNKESPNISEQSK